MEILESKTIRRKPPILVVEDEDDLRHIIATSLEKAGYEVSQASDGFVALELLKAEPDMQYLLITDIKMPRLSGDALIAEAIKLGFKFFSIIVATGEGYVGVSIVKLLAEGKAKLLQKPYTAKAMLELVNSLSHD